MDDRQWLDSVERLHERGAALQRDAAAAQAEIEAILAEHAPPAAGVVVGLDDAGRVAAVELPPGIRSSLTAEELGAQVTRAIAAATDAYRVAKNPTRLDDSGSGSGLDDLLASIFTGVPLEPERIANDFKTLTVVVLRGEIVAVELEPRWTASTKESSIAEEIVRMARIAVDASSR